MYNYIIYVKGFDLNLNKYFFKVKIFNILDILNL